MTRAEVLTVLDRVAKLRWRNLKADEIPVQFMQNRIAVILPAAAFAADEQIVLEGKFQTLMTQAGAHAYLDFVPDWNGLATPLRGGFN